MLEDTDKYQDRAAELIIDLLNDFSPTEVSIVVMFMLDIVGQAGGAPQSVLDALAAFHGPN